MYLHVDMKWVLSEYRTVIICKMYLCLSSVSFFQQVEWYGNVIVMIVT